MAVNSTSNTIQLCASTFTMETRPSPPDGWQSLSPESGRPELGRRSVSRSTSTSSASSDWTTAARSEERARYQETLDEGLNIQMNEMQTSTSPDNTYRVKGGLYSPITPRRPVSRAKSDPSTQRLIERRATQSARWTVHWWTPFLMVSSFLVGIGMAYSQHRLYSYLHHRVEDDEARKVRYVLYGRAITYFAKVSFGMCCVLVYRQRIW